MKDGWARANFNPLQPQRCFREGSLVRWTPPAGTYSPKSEQHRQAGKCGLVVKLIDSEAALVTFGHSYPVICNAAYLEYQKNG